jgi:type VI secretion system protein ImpI
MALGFRVRYRTADGHVAGERVLSELPIRFGRNVLNHCQISHPNVSDFHAVIELIDGRVSLRDLKSTNGVYTPAGERIAPNVPVDLATIGRAFTLGGVVQVHVETFEEHHDLGERLSGRSGAVLGNRAVLRSGPVDPSIVASPAAPAFAGASAYDVAPLPPLSVAGGQPAVRPPYVPASPWSGPGADQAERQSLPSLAPVHAGYERHGNPGPYPRQPPAQEPRGVSRSTQHFSIAIETLALLGLRELADSILPGVPLQTTGDVARLLTKLHDTIEVFCRCFVPLREGHAQFVSSMDLRRAASQRSLNRSRSAYAVELARDPAALAAALVDWRNQDFDAPQVVEGIFADLMMHQVALIESVLRGVHVLLEEVSPDNVERIFRDQQPGISAFLGRYRALWHTFQGHYQELTNETRIFETVFGPEFAASYRDHLSRAKNPP